MIFLYENTKYGYRITRVFGRSEIVEIPEYIGEIPVTELGDYAFSDRMDREDFEELMSSGKLCNEDGTEAFSLENQPEIAGNALRELQLSSRIAKIGRYVFYNCGNLRRISFSGKLTDIGAGALTGCHKINKLEVETGEGGSSSLREILTELPEELCVDIMKNGEKGRFWFPEFFEEGVENTPARILENHVHGSGIRYRNCFIHKSLNVREYDRLFEYAKAWENEKLVISLALDRVRYPVELCEEAAGRYLDYLKEKVRPAIWLLSAKKEYGFIGEILKEIAPSRETAEELRVRAGQKGDTELVSILMDYLHRHTKKQRKVFEL